VCRYPDDVYVIAESYLHNLDPNAIQFTDAFGIKWYGLSYLTGFIVGWLVMRWMASTGRILLTTTQVGDFITYAIVGVLVGGRLGYGAFYEPTLFIDFSSKFPFWGILAIHQGGMASHGGMIGCVIAMLLFAHRARISWLHLLDVTAFIAPPGLFFGRIANFINGELWGVPLAPRYQGNPPWWSVKYPEEVQSLPLEQIQGLAPLLQRPDATDLHQQIVVEAYAGNQVLIESLAPLLPARYPSQLFQATSDGPILLGLLIIVWLVARKPGVIAGWFLIGYGVLREITELFRERHHGALEVGEIRTAMVLSIGLILAGLILILWSSSRKVDRVGGLLRPARADAENGAPRDPERPV
jgi:phosphatidylglycerol:prolipoprotein diacylglycerol transferase